MPTPEIQPRHNLGLPNNYPEMWKKIGEQPTSSVGKQYEQEGVVPEPPKYLLEPGERVTPELVLRVGKDRWIRDYAPRPEHGRGMPGIKGEIVRHSPEDFLVLGNMEIAKRAMQSYNVNLLYGPNNEDSRYGRERIFAGNYPEFAEHNRKEHNRRVKRHFEASMANIKELRSMSGLEDFVLDGAYAFLFEHDMDQLFSIFRNHFGDLEGNKDFIGDVKAGHELAAPIMFMATIQEYAMSRYGRWDEETKAWAERVAGVFMFIAADHDSPDVFKSAIQNMTPASPDEDIDALYVRFKAGTVDRSTITWAQYFKMVVKEKSKKEFISETNPWGLPPSFVELYGDRLQALAEDNRPILSGLKVEERKALEKVALACNDADVAEYSMSSRESIWRKLVNKRSQGRPFWLGDFDILLAAVNKNRLKNKKSPLSEDDELEDIIMYAITSCPGVLPKGAACDALRSLWEYYVLEDYGYPYLRERNKAAAVMGALNLLDFGKRLMRGDSTVVTELQIRNEILAGEKQLKKCGVPEAVIQWGRITHPDDNDYISYLEQKVWDEDRTQGKTRVRAFQSTQRALDVMEHLALKNISKKIDNGAVSHSSNSIKIIPNTELRPEYQMELYHPDQILLFERVINKFIKIVCKRYKIKSKELTMYKQRVKEGKLQPFYALDTYFSGADAETSPTLLYRMPEGAAEMIRKLAA